ncbi:MAG: transcriptional regulator [Salaquimonas sp.]
MRLLQILVIGFFLAFSNMVTAAELVMLEQDGCVWCQKWHKEIGLIYPKTEESARAPLRIVNINEPIPDDLAAIPIERFTPTFILVENGEELGRIRGYPGDEFFWFLLKEMLDKSNIQPG